MFLLNKKILTVILSTCGRICIFFYYISVIIYRVLCLELLVHKNARVVSETIVMDNLNYAHNTFHKSMQANCSKGEMEYAYVKFKSVIPELFEAV